jgi:hypothetical protein
MDLALMRAHTDCTSSERHKHPTLVGSTVKLLGDKCGALLRADNIRNVKAAAPKTSCEPAGACVMKSRGTV